MKGLLNAVIMGAGMHILFVADGDDKYGASNSMRQLISELLKTESTLKISVILTWRSGMEKDLEDLPCTVNKVFYVPFYQGIPYDKWKVPIKYIVRGIEYWAGRIVGVCSVGKKVDMESVDIIHSNSSREDLGALLAEKYHKPLIWHIREFGDMDYKCFSFRKNHIAFMNGKAAEFIAVSDAVKSHWVKKGLNEKNIIRIYNGVNAIVPARNEYKNRDKDIIRFVILGSLCETKGQYQIIEACGEMESEEREKIRIDIVGDGAGAYMRKIQEKIDDMELNGCIRLLGYQKDFYKKLHEYDCGIMCSKAEGFGRVTVEYMMAGIPVIASDTGANKELVVEGKNGILYRWNDIAGLKDSILYMYTHKKQLEKMGREAHIYAKKYFSSERNAQLIYNEYLKVLNGSLAVRDIL